VYTSSESAGIKNRPLVKFNGNSYNINARSI